MCRVYLAIYPCSHAVLASFISCANEKTPQTCDPRNIVIHLQSHRDLPADQASKCPGSKSDRACLRIPLKPLAFALYCAHKKLNTSDVVALAPVWIYDLEGKKIGTRTRPWSLSDYIAAWYRVKNPNAMKNRVDTIELSAFRL